MRFSWHVIQNTSVTLQWFEDAEDAVFLWVLFNNWNTSNAKFYALMQPQISNNFTGKVFYWPYISSL